MNRLNYSKCSGVIIDRCIEHGVWLDGGELEKIYHFVNSGGIEHAKRKEVEELERRKRRLQDQAYFLQRGPRTRCGFWYFW